MDAKYDAELERKRAEGEIARCPSNPLRTMGGYELLALLDDLAALQHEKESWRLIDKQAHRDLDRYEKALKRLAEMDYACDDKDCSASDVANEALERKD